MYSGLLAVTNRKLCERDFLEQIERLAKSDIEAIILREKDLDETAYEALAESVLKICGRYKKRVYCIHLQTQQYVWAVRQYICRFRYCLRKKKG